MTEKILIECQLHFLGPFHYTIVNDFHPFSKIPSGISGLLLARLPTLYTTFFYTKLITLIPLIFAHL